jgi:LytS/YehU family sensor histidine kinase
MRRSLAIGAQVLVASALFGAVLGLLAGNRLAVSVSYATGIGLGSWLSLTILRARLMPGASLKDMRNPRGIAILGASCVLGYLAGTALVDALLGQAGATLRQLVGHPGGALGDMIVSTLVAAFVVTWFYVRARGAEQRAELAAVAQQATLARLDLLQSQLEPHMLFNTLANLRALIGVDPERAQAMLDRLIDFLRATLVANRGASTHALADEFARLEDYLALMQVRMGERLRARTELPPALAAAQVPPLLLQPLVENAIKHGLEPQRGPGELVVEASAEGATLVLRVADGGRGLAAAEAAKTRDEAPAGAGFGLAQVRERLATLHGAAARFTLAPRPGGGTLAEIRLPLSYASPTP